MLETGNTEYVREGFFWRKRGDWFRFTILDLRFTIGERRFKTLGLRL